MIREATVHDSDEIREILDAAFAPSMIESRIVSAVVSDDKPFFAWVVEIDSAIVGYILFTQATRGSEPIGFHLGPVAVSPVFQKQGLGSKLISETLQMEPLRDAPVFVLGDPRFYERFGFKETTSAICPYDEGNRHFRALRWRDAGSPFMVGYCEAFRIAEQ